MSEQQFQEIQPCPFCGGECRLIGGESVNVPWASHRFSRVYCTNCQVRQLYHQYDEEAVAAWNTRREDVAERLRGTLQAIAFGVVKDPQEFAKNALEKNTVADGLEDWNPSHMFGTSPLSDPKVAAMAAKFIKLPDEPDTSS